MFDLVVLIPLILLLVFLGIGVPIAYAFAISGTIGLFLIEGFISTRVMLANIAYSMASDYILSTVPMFILMAFYLSNSEIVKDIFNAINTWLGHVRGGMPIATTIANGGMAVLSGSSTASAGAMANISIPEMRKYGYRDKLSVATVAASGTFASMFPPSIPFIIYGILTETSIKDLFLAGIIPGLLTLLGYMILIYIWGVYDPTSFGGKVEKYSWGNRFRSFRGIWPALLVVLLTLGSLYSGVVTPTEAGAMGAFGAFIVAILFADLRLEGINKSHVETVELTAVIFLILIGAAIYGRFMTITGVIRDTVEFVSEMPLEPWIILLLIFLVYIALGSVMDQLAILIITLPVTYPIVTELGYSSIWFGVTLVKTIEIGLITPPFGMNVYVVISTIDVDANTAFRGAMRFLIVDFIVLLSLLVFPDMVSWLPNMLN